MTVLGADLFGPEEVGRGMPRSEDDQGRPGVADSRSANRATRRLAAGVFCPTSREGHVVGQAGMDVSRRDAPLKAAWYFEAAD